MDRRLIPLGLIILVAASEVGAQRDPAEQAEKSAYAAAHRDALRRAQVWLEPDTPVEEAKLGENPGGPGALAPDKTVPCRFRPGGVAGSTPKFDCELENGERIKVKYGLKNPEVYAEVVATRLLAALGFPADRVYVVDQIRCYGCPPDPFVGLQCINEGGSVDACFPNLDEEKYEEFDTAVVERPIKGRRIETSRERGWTWEELVAVDQTAGGAPRAHLDALRLMAVFLNHWDNKSKNQRLLCLGEDDPPGRTFVASPCKRPLAMIQDLGATFGPDKLDLRQWARSSIWADAATCAVSMRALPDGGSTFPDARISEEGRQFLAERLRRLSKQQLRALFEGARVPRYPAPTPEGSDVERWVSAFQDKVRAIADRGPCPA